MKHKKLLLGLLTLGLLIGGGLFAAPKSYALSTTYFPYSGAGCDVSPCGTATYPVIGESRFGQGNELDVSAYYNTGGPSNTLILKHANYCPAVSGDPDHYSGGDYFDSNPTALKDGTPVTRFTITYGGNTIIREGVYRATASSSCQTDIVVPLPGLPLDASINLYSAQVEVLPIDQHGGPCAKATPAGCDGILNYVYLQAGGPDAFKIAQNGDKVTASGHKVTIDNASATDYTDVTASFGSDCGVNGTDTYKLTYYDMDNDPGSGAQPGPKPGFPGYRVTMKLVDANTGLPVPTADPATPTVFTNSWTPPDDQNAVGARIFVPKVNGRYTWTLNDVYRQNTIQFGTPFDGIYFFKSCVPQPGCTGVCGPTPVYVKPYFDATGGDVVAGASFTTDTVTSCDVAPNVQKAGIASWNRNGSPDFGGAGTEYAARAFSIVQGFASHQPTATPAVSTSLSFANIPAPSPTTGLFGGMFLNGPCVDYWNGKPDPADPAVGSIGDGALPAGASGTYYHLGNLTIDGGTIPTGKRITIYVEGNVGITDTIKYTGDPWPDRKSIPSFRLIVLGSIFIDAHVPQLDGLYVAVPRANEAKTKQNNYGSPNAGTISTCAKGPYTSYNPPVDTAAGNPIESACSYTPLTVNGSLVAQQIWLLRSSGDLPGATAAETINYRPELWLGYPTSGSVDPNPDYDMIVGLPPQL